LSVARRPHVVVVGLGPAGTDLVGPGAAERLRDPGRTWLRTGRHPATAALEGAHTFDDVYESAGTFDEVYAAIVERLVAAAETASPEPVVYAVPGSPLVSERTVELLRSDERVEVTIVPALSFLDLAWAALGVDPLAAGVRLVDAADFADVAATERGPFLVAQCWSRHLLSEVKLASGDDAAATLPRPVLLHHLGLDDELVAEVDWWELDRTLEPDHLTSLYVPRLGDDRRRGAGAEVARLVALMDTLREQCPWDRAQDHASLMPHLVEECYEVLDALSALSAAPASAAPAANVHLEEELGDLLFQIVFHARLGAEDGFFDMAGLARTVHDKLVHRHPHVFGDVEADDAGQVMANWEEIKRSEKGRASVTEGIPAALPALVYASKLARKARSVGVEPHDQDASHAAADLAALARLAGRATPHPDDPLVRDERVERQIGDLLFAIVNLAQRVGVDAEQALRERALVLRDDIRRAEGVPDGPEGNR
jgi:tetrapyrrole methylase family protein/MazG family protein